VVDVNYTDSINENDVYDWSLTEEKINISGEHYVVRNETTGARLVICTIEQCSAALDNLENVDTCALMYAADKLLSNTDAPWSHRTRDDFDVFQILAGWTWIGWYGQYFWYTWCPPLYLSACAAAFFRSFLMPSDIRLKNLLRKCRDKELHVVYGDWLTPDWIEREHHVFDADVGAVAERYGMFGIGNAASKGEFMLEGSKLKAEWYKFLVKLEMRGLINSRYSRLKTYEEFKEANYPATYAEAVQDKRLDIYSHTINNMETNCAVVAVRPTNDVSSQLGCQLLVKRLTNEIPVKVPLKYTFDHERVEVVF